MLKNLIVRFTGSVTPQAQVLPPAKTEWHDETLFRQLAGDSKRDFCRWVLAGDMAEFFDKLDAYNAAQPEDRRITLEIHHTVTDWIGKMVKDGYHDYANTMTMAPKGGPLVLEGDMFLRAMGPQAFPGLRLRMGDQVLNAQYGADPFNSRLKVEVAPNEWRAIQFGLDTPSLFARERIAQPPLLFPPHA